jgi:hypothetical protein
MFYAVLKIFDKRVLVILRDEGHAEDVETDLWDDVIHSLPASWGIDDPESQIDLLIMSENKPEMECVTTVDLS